MLSRQDIIATVEAIYDLTGDDEQWLRRICEAAKGWHDLGHGTMAWTFDLTPRGTQLGTPVVCGGEPAFVSLPEVFVAEFGEEETREAYTAGPSATALEVYRSEVFERHSPAGIEDFLATLGLSPNGAGVVLGAASSRRITPKAPLRFRSERVAAHLAAAYRLRSAARATAEDPEAVLAPEAVLEGDGKLVHAEGAAQVESSREELRQAAQRIDKARAAQRRTAPEDALDAWQGLVSGRWSLVDRFESDGRRYLIALRNAPRVPDPRALTERERQVAAYAALGYSGKQIAYTLGIDASAVSRHLTASLRKLGLAHSSELSAYFARLVQAAMAAACAESGGGGAP